jgi:flagellar basal body-associated protein FliL
MKKNQINNKKKRKHKTIIIFFLFIKKKNNQQQIKMLTVDQLGLVIENIDRYSVFEKFFYKRFYNILNKYKDNEGVNTEKGRYQTYQIMTEKERYSIDHIEKTLRSYIKDSSDETFLEIYNNIFGKQIKFIPTRDLQEFTADIEKLQQQQQEHEEQERINQQQQQQQKRRIKQVIVIIIIVFAILVIYSIQPFFQRKKEQNSIKDEEESNQQQEESKQQQEKIVEPTKSYLEEYIIFGIVVFVFYLYFTKVATMKKIQKTKRKKSRK